MLAPFLSLIGPIAAGKRRLAVFVPLIIGWLIAGVTAAVLPAYSAAEPLGLDLAANFDVDAKTAELAAAAAPGSVPPAMKAMLDQPPARVIPGMGAAMAHRKIAYAERTSATARVISDTTSGDKRTLVLRLGAPGAAQVRLLIPSEASPSAMLLEGAPNPVEMRASPNGVYSIGCVGLSCDGKQLTLILPPKHDNPGADWIIQGIWEGLPAEAEPVRSARPPTAVQVQTGDVTLTTHRFQP